MTALALLLTLCLGNEAGNEITQRRIFPEAKQEMRRETKCGFRRNEPIPFRNAPPELRDMGRSFDGRRL